MSVLVGENCLNPIQHADDVFRELYKSWDNWRTRQGQSFVEQYQKGRVALICDLAISPANLVPDSSRSGNDPSTHEVLASIVFNADVANAVDLHHWKQEPMFIENVEPVEGPHGFIPSLVRLYGIHDETCDCFGGLGYFSTSNGGFKFLPVVPNREPSVVIKFPESNEHNFINREVQSGLEVMQCISNDKSEIIWDGLSHGCFKDIISSLRICLDTETVQVSCLELADTRLKIVDVLFGPFNL